MKINILGLKLKIINGKKLHKLGIQAKRKKTLEKLNYGLRFMKENNLKYSEYRLQKITKLSINTIKRYRKEIKKIKEEINYL